MNSDCPVVGTLSQAGAAALLMSARDVAPAANAYPLPAYEVPRNVTATEFQALPATAEALQNRRRIHALQAALSEVPGSAEGPEPVHLIVDGMYFRQLTIPAGLVVVSKRHGREHLCTVSRGSATVFTEDGMTLIQAPFSWVSPAGAKRVLFVHEEIVWATVHRTEGKTVEECELDVLMDETLLLGESK